MNHIQFASIEKSPLELDGWLQWNQEMWELQPRRVVYTPKGKDLPRLEGVLYLERSGRVRMPPRNPYLPFRFTPTNTRRLERIYRQWLQVGGLFAKELVQRGTRGYISLPPGLVDVRPFQWLGMDVSVRYTFIAQLPFDEKIAAAAVRQKIRKAERAGYYVKRSCDWEAIVHCLAETGAAKGFAHRTDINSLERCQQLLGNDHFRGYVGYNDKHKVVSGGLRLHLPDATAVAWSQGTLRDELGSGINQLLYWEVLQDLTRVGAKAFDYTGANIPPVAAAKAAWGIPLVPYLTIRTFSLRNLALQVGIKLLSRKRR